MIFFKIHRYLFIYEVRLIYNYPYEFLFLAENVANLFQ